MPNARLLLTMLVAGCATMSSPGSTLVHSDGDTSRYQVVAARLVPGETLFEALARNRPLLIHVRQYGLTARSRFVDPIGVYINGSFAGGLETLRSIPADQVYSVRRLRGLDAMNQFAGRFTDGALEVTLLRR